jgi:hypothetical protein
MNADNVNNWSRRVFRATLIYLPGLAAGMLLDLGLK